MVAHAYTWSVICESSGGCSGLCDPQDLLQHCRVWLGGGWVESFKVGKLVRRQPPHCAWQEKVRIQWHGNQDNWGFLFPAAFSCLSDHCGALQPPSFPHSVVEGLFWIALSPEHPLKLCCHGGPYQDLKLQTASLSVSLKLCDKVAIQEGRERTELRPFTPSDRLLLSFQCVFQFPPMPIFQKMEKNSWMVGFQQLISGWCVSTS